LFGPKEEQADNTSRSDKRGKYRIDSSLWQT
jgi:hypothetical protein